MGKKKNKWNKHWKKNWGKRWDQWQTWNSARLLIIEPEVFKKLFFYCQAAPGEISGFAKTVMGQTGDIRLIDIRTFPQKCNGAHTEISSESMAKFLVDLARTQEDPKRWNCWWHTHPDFQTYFSMEDLNTIKQLSKDSDLVSICVNRSGESSCRLDNGLTTTDLTAVTLPEFGTELDKRCQLEVANKVTEDQLNVYELTNEYGPAKRHYRPRIYVSPYGNSRRGGSRRSFLILTLSKMGTQNITVFDEDGVSDNNLPNQFFRHEDIGQFKVDALQNIVFDFADTKLQTINRFYEEQPLNETVFVATDSMHSRRIVWEQFLIQPHCTTYIEARMGAELGMVYTFQKKKGIVSPEDITFYEDVLYPDSKVKPLPCTGRSIIYNVLMLASLIARSYKGIIQHEEVPREQIFNMTYLRKNSYMVRQ